MKKNTIILILLALSGVTSLTAHHAGYPHGGDDTPSEPVIRGPR